MKPMHLYLKAVQLKQLKSLARQTGAPVAVLIRKAIDEYIARRKAEKPAVRPNGAGN